VRPSSTIAVTNAMNVSQWVNVTITNFNWGCNCSNSRYPKIALNNASVQPSNCGCNNNALNTNQTCSCCVSRSEVDNLYLATKSCGSSLTLSTCQCNGSMSCNCAPVNSSIIYTGLKVSSSACLCVGQNCQCCLASQSALIPKAPVC
jgi:hypothetical protein